MIKILIFTALLLELTLLQFTLFSLFIYAVGATFLYFISSTGRYSLFFSYWMVALFAPLGLYLLHTADLSGLSLPAFIFSFLMVAAILWGIWLGLVEFYFKERSLVNDLFYLVLVYLVSVVAFGYVGPFDPGIWTLIIWVVIWFLTAEFLIFNGHKGFDAWAVSAVMAFIVAQFFWIAAMIPYLNVLLSALLVSVIAFLVYDTFMTNIRGDLTKKVIFRQLVILLVVIILVL